MTRQAALAIHLAALATLALAIIVVAASSTAPLDVLAAGLLGFATGVLFDRLALRPVVDWRMAHGRR